MSRRAPYIRQQSVLLSCLASTRILQNDDYVSQRQFTKLCEASHVRTFWAQKYLDQCQRDLTCHRQLVLTVFMTAVRDTGLGEVSSRHTSQHSRLRFSSKNTYNMPPVSIGFRRQNMLCDQTNQSWNLSCARKRKV